VRPIHDSFSMVLIMGLLGERQDGLRRGPAPMAKLFPRPSFSLPKDFGHGRRFPAPHCRLYASQARKRAGLQQARRAAFATLISLTRFRRLRTSGNRFIRPFAQCLLCPDEQTSLKTAAMSALWQPIAEAACPLSGCRKSPLKRTSFGLNNGSRHQFGS
jgi:hypothetical protein